MLAGEDVHSTCENAQFEQMMGNLPLYHGRATSSKSTSEPMYYISLSLALVSSILISIIYAKMWKSSSARSKDKCTDYGGSTRKDNKDKGNARLDFAELTYISALLQTQRSFSPPFLKKRESKTLDVGDNELEAVRDPRKLCFLPLGITR